jgi:hypothetical protein
MDLSADVARRLRLRSLLLDPKIPADRPATVAGIVEWFGAMQAQDANSAVWSLGSRLPGSTVADVWAALERVEAVRTWPMRGTVHLVPPRDARWMLELMGPGPLAAAAKRRETIGLADTTVTRVVDTLGATLAGGRRLTRSACLDAIRAAGIGLESQQQYHVLWYASQIGVTVMHANVGAEATFTLLDELVPDPHRPSRAEALATMAQRYVRSHGPTTRQDFAGWTGLGAADAKAAIAGAGDTITTVSVEGREMLVDRDVFAAGPLPAAPGRQKRTPSRPRAADHLALAGFDEFMLGYKDRSLFLDPGGLRWVVPGGNGVFRATLVRAGQVVATWKRGSSTKVVEVHPITDLDAAERAEAEAAFAPYATFLGRPVEIRWQ